MTLLRAVMAWMSPVVLASLAARVFAGDADAPLMILLVVVAPLVALLWAEEPREAASGLALLTVPGVALIHAANVLVIVDLAGLHGIARTPSLVSALLLAAVIPLAIAAVGAEWSALLGGLGVAGTMVALGAIAVATGVTPWSAWSQIAARPALHFAERSGWVTEGRAPSRSTTLSFTEPHRVTAITPGIYRLIENDGDRRVPRERRLARGESLVLRPGDRLLLEAGARVRFERDKRVPGALASGTAWAAPRRRPDARTVVDLLGAAVTMVCGALALIAPSRRVPRGAALAAPLSLLAFALSAACCGIYAMYAAPDLSIGAVLLTALAELPFVVLAPPFAEGFRVAIGGVLLALFVASAGALWRRVRDVATDSMPPNGWSSRLPVRTYGLWIAICAAAAIAALWPMDPWRTFLAGVGLLASTWAAATFARGDRWATIVGATTGMVAFGAVAMAAQLVPSWPLGSYPALVAAPVAAAVARSCSLSASRNDSARARQA